MDALQNKQISIERLNLSARVYNALKREGIDTLQDLLSAHEQGTLYGIRKLGIIIVDVDDKSFVDEERKQLFYVGSSRAKHQLDILFVGDEEMLRNAGRGLSDQSFPNARIGIARCLNVKPIMAKE